MYMCAAPCSIGKHHKRIVKGKVIDKRHNKLEKEGDKSGKSGKRKKETRIHFRDLRLPVKVLFKSMCLTERHLKAYHGWVDKKKAAVEENKISLEHKKAVKSLDNAATQFILDTTHGSHSIIQGSPFKAYLKSYGDFCLKFQKNPIDHNMLR